MGCGRNLALNATRTNCESSRAYCCWFNLDMCDQLRVVGPPLFGFAAPVPRPWPALSGCRLIVLDPKYPDKLDVRSDSERIRMKRARRFARVEEQQPNKCTFGPVRTAKDYLAMLGCDNTHCGGRDAS